MALQLASILDRLAFNPEWYGLAASTLNNTLQDVRVSPNYSVLATIADRSYLFTSNSQGRLSATIVPPGRAQVEALKESQARVVVDASAFKDGLDDDSANWEQKMMAARKLRVEGNNEMLYKLQDEISSYIGKVQGDVDAAGPRPEVARAALQRYNEEWSVQQGPRFKDQVAVEQEITQWGDVTNTWQPELIRFHAWLLFSAMSNPMGNMGQANYCAANLYLDVITQITRQSRGFNFDAIAFMWGAVGGLGMRWKAFASQDFLAKEENSILMSAMQAQTLLRYLVSGVAPEWLGAQFATQDWSAMIKYCAENGPIRYPDAWGWGKGKGGGESFHEPHGLSWEDGAFRQGVKKPTRRPPDSSWLFPGRRVRAFGLTTNVELNEAKGTLVEEVEDSMWVVSFDDGLGEKVVKVGNMKTLAGMPVPVDGTSPKVLDTAPCPAKIVKASPIGVASLPQEVCEYSLAGSWDEWMPHNMTWDAEQMCHTYTVQVNTNTPQQFSLCLGKAGTKKWKGKRQTWSVGAGGCGAYQITVSTKEGGAIKKVDVARVSSA